MTDPLAFPSVTISAVCVDEYDGDGGVFLPPVVATAVAGVPGPALAFRLISIYRRKRRKRGRPASASRTPALNQTPTSSVAVVALRHVANSISSRKSSKVPRPPREEERDRGREGGRGSPR